MTNQPLKITGITEKVKWNKSKDSSLSSWSAGISIEGLVPALVPGGYKYTYIIELIASGGNVVHSGVITQAPGCNSTKTTIRIGGQHPPGYYTVKVFGGGEQDMLRVLVPDILDYIKDPEIPKPRNIISRLASKQKYLRFVKELFVEKENGKYIVGIERPDGTKYSVLLEDTDGIPILNNYEIYKLRDILTKLKDRILNFAEQYANDDRKEIEFLHDLIAMAKYLSKLHPTADFLMDMGAPSDLMHNRLQAQLFAYYDEVGCDISRPTNLSSSLKHDFNIGRLRCEVKTIQSIGNIEPKSIGGFQFSAKSLNSLNAAIIDDLDKAMTQIGKNGMIFIAPWSYRINSILRQYFLSNLMLFPPAPAPNLTVLVLTTDRAFNDEYVTFNTNTVKSSLAYAFNNIQMFGLTSIKLNPIRKGLPIQIGTAVDAGSAAGVIFNINDSTGIF